MKYTRLDNPHAHFPRPKNKKQLGILFNNLLGANIEDKLTSTSASHWNDRVQHCLKPQDLEEISRTYTGQFKIKYLGHQTYRLSLYDNFIIHIYCSQEIRTKEGPHITAECCTKPIEEEQELEKTIDQVHKLGGKAILEHPFTRNDPIRQFRYVIDGKYRNNVIKSMSLVDGIEVFNSMNTWWQFFSNLFAKDSAKKTIYRNGIYIPLLAGGDEHYNIQDIGSVGNLLQKEDLSQATGLEIQQWRWQQYKQGNFKRKEQLTTLYTFARFMMLPTIKRLLLRKEKDFKDVFGKVI